MTRANGTDEAGNDAHQSNPRAYRSRIGLMADSPNFPAPWKQIVEKVRIADRLGFDSIWVAESWGYELFSSMADLVGATERIKIGSGIANIYSRTPALIASAAATLDERSGGRIILGLGTSGANVIEDWHGVPFEKPLPRTREYIDIIRMILRGEKLVYQSEFFHLERGFKLRFKPLRANLPIYVAAMGPKNIAQTGELADGILPVHWPSSRWSALREQLDEGSVKAGRPAHSAAIAPYITWIPLSEGASEEEKRAAYFKAASPLAYYVGRMGKFYAQMLTRNGYGEDVQRIITGWQQGMKSAIEAVSPRLLDATTVIGSVQECVAKLDAWAASGVDQPILSMPEGSVDEVEVQLSALREALAAE